jgi:filamentous hemagglutinin family protein
MSIGHREREGFLSVRGFSSGTSRRKAEFAGVASVAPVRCSMRRRLVEFVAISGALLGLSAASALAQPALPTGGQFTAGAGAIAAAGANALQINQQSARGVIDWRSFSIGAGGSVSINNGSGATLNRVTGGQVSQIQGALSATGSLYLINPQGVVIDKGGQVLGGGSVVLSTRNIANSDFMGGGSATAIGSSVGDVTNRGSVVARQGDVVILARSVTNSGSISAANGMATLAAGNTFVLAPLGSGAGVVVSSDPSAKGDVTQAGRVEAAAAALTAAGGNVYSLAGATGITQATGTSDIDGHVWLTAPNGDVVVSGTVGAKNNDGSGGQIIAAGRAVTIGSTAILDAAGTKGGQVLVGVTAPQSNLADITKIEEGAQILASGTTGGGSVETSGHTLKLGAARIDTGLGGAWLLDPTDLTIDSPAATTINASLNGGSTVTQSATRDITLSAPILWSNLAGALVLNAGNSVTINSSITGNGSLSIVMGTDRNLGDAALNINQPINIGSLNLNSGNTITYNSNVSANTAITALASSFIVVSNGITVHAGTTVNMDAHYYQFAMNAGSAVTAGGDIQIGSSGGAFVNNSGASAIVSSGGHYRIYSKDPSLDTAGGLANDYRQYNANLSIDSNGVTTATTPLGTGNGFLYSLAPVLKYSVIGSVTKVYDGTTTASGLTLGSNVSITGLQTGDVASLASSTGTFSQADVGSSLAVTIAGLNIVNSGKPVFGYVPFSANQNSGVIGTIQPAQLTVSLGATTTSKAYDGTSTASVNPANFLVTGWVNSETGSVAQVSSASYQTSGGVDNATVLGVSKVRAVLDVTDFTASNKITNYTLGLPSAAQTMHAVVIGTGSITPAPLSITVVGNPTKDYDASTTFNAATTNGSPNTGVGLTSGNFLIGGFVGGQGATISQPVGTFDDPNAGIRGISASLTNGNFNLSGGADLSNYSYSATVSGFGTIVPVGLAPIGGSLINAKNKTYDGATTVSGIVGADFAFTGWAPGEGSDLVLNLAHLISANYASKNAGLQPINVQVDTTNLSGNTNYSFYTTTTTNLTNYVLPTGLVGSGTIFRRDISAAMSIDNNPTKFYNGTNVAALSASNFAALVTGVAGETITINQSVGTYSSVNAGSRTVTASLGGGNFVAGGGALLSNYILPTTASGAGTIAKAPVVAQIIGNPTKVYNADFDTVGVNSSTGLLSANYLLQGFIAGEGATVSQGTGLFNNQHVGVNVITAALAGGNFTASGGTDLNNYALPTAASGAGTVTPFALTVVGATVAPSKVYDNSNYIAISGGSLPAVFAADVANVTLTQGSGRFADKNVGVNKPITAQDFALGGTAANDYTLSQPTGLLSSITKADLTAIVEKSYDGTNRADGTISGITYTFHGVYNGDVVNFGSTAAITGTFSSAHVDGVTATPAVALNVNLTGLDSGNYQLSSVTGVINPVALTATGVVANNKIYDTTTAATLGYGGAALSGLKAADVGIVTLDTSHTAGTFANPNVGTGITVTANSSFAVLGNTHGDYNFTYNPTLAADIIAANATVTLNLSRVTKVYDGTTSLPLLPSAYTLTGILGSDNVNIASATGSYASKNVGTNIAITTTALTLGGAQAANYTINNVTGALIGDITPRLLTVALNPKTMVYTAGTAINTLATSDFILGNLVSGETTTINQTSGTYNTKVVGSGNKTITASLANGNFNAGSGGFLAANYSLPATVANTASSITPAPLTVNGLTGVNRVYNALTNASVTGTAALSGVLLSDVVNLNGGSASFSFADKNVANSKVITALGYTISGADFGNYTLSQPTGITANITPATLTYAGATSAGRVYDGTSSAQLVLTGASLTSGFSGDAVALASINVAGSFVDKNVGSNKAVTINVQSYNLVGADAGNYIVVGGSAGVANITARPLTAGNMTANNKVYDSTTAATLDNSGTILQPQGPGVGYIPGDAVTLITSGSTGVFVDKNATAFNNTSVTVSGYSITGADISNYVFTQPTGVAAVISRAPLTLNGLTGVNRVYDGTVNATVTGSPTLVGLFSGDVVTVFGGSATHSFTDKNVGNTKAITATGYQLSGADFTNYNFTQPLGITASITPAPLTVNGLTGVNRVYNALTNASVTGTAALSGVLSSDVVTLNGGSATFSFLTKSVGTGKSITTLGYTVSGADAGNYTFTQPLGITANITPAPLTVNGLTGVNRVYNALTNASASGTAALNGVLLTDVVNLNGGSASFSFADKNVANGKAITALGYTISGADFGNYTLSQPTGLSANITPAPLTVGGLTGVNRVYNATTGAAVTGAAALSGLLLTDTATLGGTGSFSFLTKTVANGKTIAASGYTVSGGDSANYTFSQPTGITANITPAPITVTGLTAANKVYDATTAATIDASLATPTGVIGGDVVTLSASLIGGTFADKNVGVGKMVTATLVGATLGGADGGNYVITAANSPIANITAKSLTASLTPQTKAYDGDTAAGLTTASYLLTGLAGGETLTVGRTSGAYNSPDVASATSVTVTGLTGVDYIGGAGFLATNYVLPTSITGLGTITPLSLRAVISGTPTKTFDGNTVATLTPGDFTVTGFITGQGTTVNQTVGTYAAPGAGPEGVSAVLAPGNFAATGSTLLSNYILPASAVGTGLINAAAGPATPTLPRGGNTASAATGALVNLGITLTPALTRSIAHASFAVANVRTYIPYPAPGALSSWRNNGWGTLPIVVDETTDFSATQDELGNQVVQSGAPVINSTEQILTQGGKNKRWRITIPQFANGPSLFAAEPVLAAQ